jgi:hypothetical protein
MGLTPEALHLPTLVGGKATPPFPDRVGQTALNGSSQQHHGSVEPQTEPTQSHMYVLAPAHRVRSSETRFIILAHVCARSPSSPSPGSPGSALWRRGTWSSLHTRTHTGKHGMRRKQWQDRGCCLFGTIVLTTPCHAPHLVHHCRTSPCFPVFFFQRITIVFLSARLALPPA